MKFDLSGQAVTEKQGRLAAYRGEEIDMMTSFYVRFSWVPESCGGHGHDPWVGMRPIIRLQRDLGSSADGVHGAECRVEADA